MTHPRRRPSARAARSGRWRLSRSSLIPATLALAGMIVFAYPTIASWISQYNQSQVVADYSAAVDHTSPDAATQLANARAYNDALSVGAVLQANTNVPTGAGEAGEQALSYDQILDVNGAGLMARLKIPAIDLDLPVYHGTADQTLLEGLGHLEGTSLPVGGPGTRSVITGHRGLANAVMFTNLDRVETGDTFVIEVFGEVLTYRVVETKVVEPEQTEELRAEPGRDLVTLVTCTPLGINTHRILVTGERIVPTPAEDLAAAGSPPDVPSFPWWAVTLAGGVVLIGLYVWRAGCPPRPRGGGPVRAGAAPSSGAPAPAPTPPDDAAPPPAPAPAPVKPPAAGGQSPGIGADSPEDWRGAAEAPTIVLSPYSDLDEEIFGLGQGGGADAGAPGRRRPGRRGRTLGEHLGL